MAAAAADLAAAGSSREATQLLPEGLHAAEQEADPVGGDRTTPMSSEGSKGADAQGKTAGPGTHGQAQRRRGRQRGGWGLVFHSPYFRRSCQCSCGVVIIMILLSIPPVFDAIAVDPIMANGSLCLVLFFMVLLVSLATADAPIRVAAEQIIGSLGGGGVGVGAIYLTMAINGGTYQNTVTKAAVMVSISAVVMFLSTVFRFRYKSVTLVWQFFSLTYAITTAASYHAQSRQWEFTLFWFAYSGIGGAVAYLCATFVLPVTAGAIVRRRLAAGLELTADALRQLVELIAGDVSSDSGLLAAASGETAERIGLDSGLYPHLQALYGSATAAGQAIQAAYSHLGSAPLQLDVYRRQRRFPLKPWQLLTTLTRSLLNTVMLMVYPAQTGTMHCLLLARHRAPLLALAHAIEECCTALGDVFVQNAPVSVALEKLVAVEASYASLAAATRFKGSTLTQDRMALDMVLSLLFTACTRLRRMAVLLPEALGRDQPSSLRPVLDHFAPELEAAGEEGPLAGTAGAHGEVKWDFAALTQIPLQRQESNPIDLLRASLLAVQPKRSASRAAKELLAQPDVLRLPRPVEPQGALHRSLARLKASTGVTPEHLALGLQMVAAYVPLLLMLAIPAVNSTFDGHLVWALFVVVSVLQPSTGAAIFKGLQRLAGTVLAGALGVASQYAVYLVNGLTYQNSALKFAAMTVILALLAGLLAAASVKFPKYSYVFIIGDVVLAITALPGYQSDVVRPLVAVWRVANTALGVVVEVAAVSLILPVTARQLFRATMAATLDRMAGVARIAFQSLLPPPPRSSHASRTQLLGPKAQEQGNRQAAGHHAEQQQRQQQQQHQEGQHGHVPLPGQYHEHLGQQKPQHQQSQQQHGQLDQQQSAQQQPAPAGGGALASPFALPLPALPGPPRQQGGQQGQEDVVIEMQGGARVVLRSLRTHAVARRSSSGGGAATAVLSPRSNGAGSVRRRRPSGNLEQGGAEAAPCASPRSEGGGSDATGGMTIIATVGRMHTFKIIGSVYARLLPDAFSTSAGIVAMLGMGPALHYEFYPRSAIHRFPFDAGFRAQRLCRHMLNIVAGAVIVLDSHEVSGLPMLAPFGPRLEQLIEQLAACLVALAAMVRKQASPDKAVETVLALEEHVQRLFLLVLASDLPPGLGEADAINGLALLSVLINASYVARLLALALIRTFHPSPPGAGALPAEAALLGRGSAMRWAADDRTLQLGLGILGVALGAGSTSAASASAGGGMTPRGATPRGATPRGATPLGGTPAAATPLGASPPWGGASTPLWGGTPVWGSAGGSGVLGRLHGSGSGDGSLDSVLPGRPAM
ncbi:hypothetical protein ABPG75_013309 [Micractinium tetrahymenae]